MIPWLSFGRHGTGRISKTLESLQKTLENLDKGIKECRDDVEVMQEKGDTEAALSLLRTISQAENLKGVIENALGKP